MLVCVCASVLLCVRMCAFVSAAGVDSKFSTVCVCVCVCVCTCCHLAIFPFHYYPTGCSIHNNCLRKLKFLENDEAFLLYFSAFHIKVFICPIAIAYSMGQIIKLVCICHCVSVCICPSVCTLMVVFLDRFSPKLAET